MEPPQRAIELVIKIGGDTPADVIGAIDQILFEFTKGEKPDIRAIVSGSPSCGWYTVVQIQPEITADEYRLRLFEYRAWVESQKDE